MKHKLIKFAAVAVVPAAFLVLASCKSTGGESTTIVAAQKGVPGGVIVETYQTTATVTGIDADKRKVTLITPDGTKTTFKAGPEVANFNQIQVGDQVKATVAEQLVVVLRKPGQQAAEGEAAAVGLAPEGAKPGMFMAETVQVDAKVTAINLKHHKATLLFPDGKSQTFKVRDDVDLTKVALGQNVTIRTTEAMAIVVEKP
jgi:translation elongation factor P/translation initiation factor 5A